MIINVNDIITSALYLISDNKDTDTNYSVYSTSYTTFKDGNFVKTIIYCNYNELFEKLNEIYRENLDNSGDNMTLNELHEYIIDTMTEDILKEYGVFHDFTYIKVTEYKEYKKVFMNINPMTGEYNVNKSDIVVINDFYIDSLIFTLCV